MKLALAILLNAALAVLFWRWLMAQLRVPRLGRWVLPTLLFKLLAWAAACWKPSSDAFHMQQFSSTMTRQLWERPGAWLQAMLGNEFHYSKKLYLVYHGYSNTFFTAKILSVLNLASYSSNWGNGLYLSLFCFVACWVLVRTVAQVFPQTPAGAALIGFMAWPMVVYWTAGITKESLVLGSAAGLVAIVVRWLYGNKAVSIISVIGFVLLAVLQFKMRYFFAALLFAALGGVVLMRLLELLGVTRRWLLITAFVAAIGVGTWVGSEVTLVFRTNRITLQLLRNYNQLSRESEGKPRIVFVEFRPTAESALRNAPQAAWEAISRPWFWEGGALYKVAGLENLVLLAVLAVAVVATLRGQPGRLPFALVMALLFYCLALAVLLGLSTPNLGTLNRYRAALLPFVLWLALQNDYAARVLRRFGL
ncbi:hypothetical protein J0X19_00860 [Hymenobacter sp. BT186]|uniref:Uncharacterized protein n=1 Tax=Hymenobacter telluris TaxID=2816474 RepID=A0A939ET62_9BACT|nr:hypothetical protein [Hymenobacter telluris]MBO0356481.1 hypothetical protein [Hymenobacter telluris]MBW3372505.1 hypothetical protein [Hymenobacter norwichensis]